MAKTPTKEDLQNEIERLKEALVNSNQTLDRLRENVADKIYEYNEVVADLMKEKRDLRQRLDAETTLRAHLETEHKILSRELSLLKNLILAGLKQ